MAIISYKELLEVIKSHPDYMSKWQMDVEADVAFAIDFAEGATAVDVLSLELPSGVILTIDLDDSGNAVCIEFS